ncbi:DUF1254 domain-containing protein [Phenylobacterium sp.]|uniref:DUF1254 domain-containing protein n=1 Tax=Phenylobacterium sp. TaxID=1871053 RepID=UPI0039196FC9
MIDRRQMLAAAAAAGLAGPAAAAPSGLRQAARDAWIFTLPLMEIARTRHMRAAAGINRLGHAQALSDYTARAVTTPNNDTLYSSAQIDLSRGPASFTVPSGRGRYISVALMDAYSNNFAVLGTRTTPDGGTFTLVGPGAEAPKGAIRSPTNHVWLLGRTLVASADDFAEARRVAEGITLTAPKDVPPAPPIPRRGAPWGEYFRTAGLLLGLNPPLPGDAAMVRRMAPLGLGPDFDPARFTPAQAAEIEAGVADARASLRGGVSGRNYVQGWSYPKADLGDFGQDYQYRAAVALGGLAALTVDEAVYMQAEGEGRGRFAPGGLWRLHFPAGRLPPVDAFWSLSMYEATPEGQYFFTRNPLDRYAIGDRTPGLAHNADGSLDIWIGHADPGPERRSNWLPAPAAPFSVFLRAYLPRAELRNGRYRLPPLRRA